MGQKRRISSGFIERILDALPSLCLAYLGTPPLFLLDKLFNLTSPFLIPIKILILAFLFLTYYLTSKRFKQISLIGVSTVSTLYVILLILLLFHLKLTGTNFDIFLYIDNSQEVISTILRTVESDTHWIYYILALSVAVAVFWFYLRFYIEVGSLVERKLKLKLKTQSRLTQTSTPFFGLLLLSVLLSDCPYVSGEWDYFHRILTWRSIVTPIVPDYSYLKTNSSDNVIVLRLESVNALALFSKFSLHGRTYSGSYAPVMTKIAKQGIFFPNLWANSVYTNRAWESILCGISNNVGLGFSSRPQDLKYPCLPKLLKNSGYKTTFFYSYFNLGFANAGPFMKTAGLDEVYLRLKVMQPSDPETTWGYDDCVFYKRAFETMSRSHSERRKQFLYFDVSMNHYPFPGNKEYKSLHPFSSPANFVERYLNSASEQDHCLGVFYDEFRKWDPGNTHLYVVGDHSFPVGMHGSEINYIGYFNENFLVPLLYIPPRKSKAEFGIGRVVKDRYGQNDILPTVFDLLNGSDSKYSFSFSTRKSRRNPQYEPCYLVSQPYSGRQVILVNRSEKYVYFGNSQRLIYFDLERDFAERSPQLISASISYEEFKNRYFCPRYQ